MTLVRRDPKTDYRTKKKQKKKNQCGVTVIAAATGAALSRGLAMVSRRGQRSHINHQQQRVYSSATLEGVRNSTPLPINPPNVSAGLESEGDKLALLECVCVSVFV